MAKARGMSNQILTTHIPILYNIALHIQSFPRIEQDLLKIQVEWQLKTIHKKTNETLQLVQLGPDNQN